MGKVFNRLVRLFVVGGFRDTQCGFKLLDGGVARELFAAMVIDRFAFDVELVWLALRRGYRVTEVGVEWRDSPQSRVHPLRDASRMFVDLLRIRWRHRREPGVLCWRMSRDFKCPGGQTVWHPGQRNPRP